MKLSLFGRLAMALLASVALGLGMTACGGGTIGYMWVLGQQYNRIAGFKIDDYTGNLTTVEGSPFSTGGTNPVSILVKPGGRYVYVINQGTGGGPSGSGASSGIVEFAVGGDGALTYQNTYHSQGFVPVWAQFDPGGTYLYVLDKYSPGPIVNSSPSPNTDGNGSITVFSSDSVTGQLTLVTNSQTQIKGVNTTFFEVGANPLMMKTAGACLFTVDAGDQTVFPYAINGSQLDFTTNGPIQTNATSITSINGGGQNVYLTDSNNGSTTANYIYPYTISGSCNLTIVTGGREQNYPGTANPSYSFLDKSGKYLYVLNQGTTLTQPGTSFSSISAFNLVAATGQLEPTVAGSPYTVGSGPVCMVEDESSQYMYVSNHNDGTVTGKAFDATTGELSDLKRGATFPATGDATCLTLSGAVD